MLDGYKPKDDEIEWKDDSFDQDYSSDDPVINILIFGTLQLQRNIRQLCTEFMDIFRNG